MTQAHPNIMSSFEYVSTRASDTAPLSFEQVVIRGLAPDGGLYVPTAIPKVSAAQLAQWEQLSFVDLAFEVLSLYISRQDVPAADLKDLVTRSYSTFRSEHVTPLVELNRSKSLHVLELFHGPTYAFKDVALQFVGNLFEYFLQKRNKGKAPDASDREIITVVGATSGDTGSAAIYGLRGKKDVSVFILYPTGRVSPIQEMQMTTVLDDNVHTISVAGTFDDCQDLVKQVFGDKAFNDKYHVGAVNSINWARILAQMTYYFYTYLQLKKNSATDPRIRFLVPTGNFGDILAGFYARRMGLPMDSLVIATNANDILHRFFATGSYSKAAPGEDTGHVRATHSPAMDILVSSNFERFLWYLATESITNGDQSKAGALVSQWMDELKTKGAFTLDKAVVDAARAEFCSRRTSNDETIETIRSVYTSVSPKYIVDPHTAVAVHAALACIEEDSNTATHTVALSTAHPAKFAEAVDLALKSQPGYSFEDDVLPEEFKLMAGKESKKKFADKPDIEVIKGIISATLDK